MSYPTIYRLEDESAFHINSDAENGTNGWSRILGWKLLPEIDLGSDTFDYNGETFDKIYASSIGYLSFESLAGDNNGKPVWGESVDYFITRKMIAALWDDMNTGTPPPTQAQDFATMYKLDTVNKTFTIIWDGFQWFCYTFQVMLLFPMVLQCVHIVLLCVTMFCYAFLWLCYVLHHYLHVCPFKLFYDV